MNALWIVAGLAIVGTGIAVFTSWRRSGHAADMGAVSDQWIAEQRLGSGQDSRR